MGDTALRAPELAEDGCELGEVGGEDIVVSKDAPVTVNVEIIPEHLQFDNLQFTIYLRFDYLAIYLRVGKL